MWRSRLCSRSGSWTIRWRHFSVHGSFSRWSRWRWSSWRTCWRPSWSGQTEVRWWRPPCRRQCPTKYCLKKLLYYFNYPFSVPVCFGCSGHAAIKTYSKSSAHQISGITFVRPSYLICSSLICVSVFFLSTLISSMYRMNIFLRTTRFSKIGYSQ